MRALTQMALGAIGAGLILTGCGATDSGGARDAAERLYAAYAQNDGAAACAELSPDTRKQLVESEGKPCAEAVLGLRLSGTRVVATDAYLTEAKVDLDGGDSVFLEETADGWQVDAAGCKPVPDQEVPYDCEVES